MKFKNNYQLIGLRLTIVSILVLAIVSPRWLQAGKQISTIFVLDVSDSVTVVHKKMHANTVAVYQQQIADYLASLAVDCRWGAIFFGAEAEIARRISQYDGEIRLPAPKVSGNASNLRHAIELALSLSATEPYRRVILISDGQFSSSDRRQALSILASENVTLIFLSALTEDLNLADVSLDNLVVAPMAYRQEQVSGYTTLYSSCPGRFRVVVASGKELLRDVRLTMTTGGSARIYFSLAVTASSQQVVQAWVESLSFPDHFRQNNHYRTQIRVVGPSRLLVVGSSSLTAPLAGNITLLAPEKAARLSNFSEFQAIIITQGHAITLAPAFAALQRYVFLGGGLFILGGEDTLGPGGYSDTPLEKALPVWCLPESRRPLALLVALDVSGSMGEVPDGNSKMQQARQTLARSLSLLADDDLFSLLAFRDQSRIIIPFMPVRQVREQKLAVLQKLQPHGGTDLAEALQKSSNSFQVATHARRHLLVISDGISGKHKLALAAAANLSRFGTSVSVVATGKDPDKLLRRVAAAGGGQFYYATSASLSQVVEEDLRWLQRSLIKQAAMTVHLVPDPILQKPLAYCQGRKFHRMVRVRLKSWGKSLLQDQSGAPILAVGHYGSGRSAVFTTNFSPAWGGELAEKNNRILPDIVAWLAGTMDIGMTTQLITGGNLVLVRVIIDKGTKDNRSLHIAVPWKNRENRFTQVGPGEYLVKLPLPVAGDYQIEIRDPRRLPIQLNFSIPYPTEYRRLGRCEFSPSGTTALTRSNATNKSRQRSGSLSTKMFIAMALLLFLIERLYVTWKK